MPYKQFLGYERGEDGVPVINEKEAEVVRLIYKLFLQGKTATGICKQLELMYKSHLKLMNFLPWRFFANIKHKVRLTFSDLYDILIIGNTL